MSEFPEEQIELAEPQVMNPDEFAKVFDDWLAGASLTRIPVKLYFKQHLYGVAELLKQEIVQHLENIERLSRAGATYGDEVEDRALGEKSPLAEIHSNIAEEKRAVRAKHEKLTEVLSEYESSAVIFFVKDISKRMPELSEACGPRPKEPVAPRLPANATDAQKRSHTTAMQRHEVAVAEYEKATSAWHEEFGYRIAAAGIDEVRHADGTKFENVTFTYEQILATAEQLGDTATRAIVDKVNTASLSRPVIDAPLLPASFDEEEI